MKTLIKTCVYTVCAFCVSQISGEVFSQTGSRQRGEQNDPEQHRHRPGPQPAVGQD